MTRRELIASSLGAGLAACWLLPGAARTITFEDAGELVSAAFVLGVPHPPGYPLWTALCGAFVHAAGVVGASPAAAAAAFSALCVSLACGVVALAFARRGAPTYAAGPVGASLALLPTVGALGTVAEVYGLALLFQALLVLAALDPAPRPRLACAALGLGLAAHPGTIHLAPLALAALVRAGRAGPGEWVRRAGLLALGPLTYLWVPLRSLADPAVDWGDPQTAERLWQHLVRSQYAVGLERTASDLARLGESLVEQTFGQAPVLLALGAVLALALGRDARGRWWLVLSLALGTALVVAAVRYPFGRMEPLDLWSARARLAPSFAPLLLVLHALAFVGVEALARRVRGAPWVWVAALALLPLRGGTVLDGATRGAASTGAAVWARDVLDECPPNALLVVNRIGATDVLGFPLLYEQVVGGRRADAVVVDRQLLLAPWYREQLARRAPDLAPWLDALAAGLPATADQGALHRAVGAAIGGLVGGAREVVFTDPPGALAAGGRALVPGRVLWFTDAAPSGTGDGEPSAPWLAEEPPSPWRELHRLLASERDEARARRLEDAGRAADAERLRARARALYGAADPRSL